MKHHYSAVYGEVTIRPLERKDIENLRIWRNDASQTRFLRNIGHITREMQEKWYEGYRFHRICNRRNKKAEADGRKSGII